MKKATYKNFHRPVSCETLFGRVYIYLQVVMNTTWKHYTLIGLYTHIILTCIKYHIANGTWTGLDNHTTVSGAGIRSGRLHYIISLTTCK